MNTDELKAHFLYANRPRFANKNLANTTYAFRYPDRIDSCIYQVLNLGYSKLHIEHIQHLLDTQKASIYSAQLLCIDPILELMIPVFEAGNIRIDDEINLTTQPKGFTFLHKLVQNNHLAALRLFQHPFDINKQDSEGNTALHIALAEGHFEVAAYLIQQGADISIQNKEKKSANDFLIFATEVVKNVHSINLSYNDSSERSFNSAVQEFLAQHKLKNLTELFPNTENFLQKAFWSLKALDYLTHQQKSYEIPSGKPNIANFLEIELYDCIKNYADFRIPYRDPINKFFKEGTLPSTSKYLLSLVNQRHPQVNEGPIYLYRPRDVYQQTSEIAWLSALGDLKADKNGFAYLLTACPKDNHIYPMFSIVNVKTRQPVAQYFLNSWDKEEYYNYTNDRIGLRFEEDNVYERIPLFNLSFHVQTDKKDENCGLYTNAILEAMIKLWENNPELYENLAKHATSVREQKQKVDYHYTTPLFKDFTDAIKRNLPQFFDDQLNPKQFEALRSHFLQKRWNVGCSTIRENQRKCVQYFNAILPLLRAHQHNLEVHPLTIPEPLPIAPSSEVLEYTIKEKQEKINKKNQAQNQNSKKYTLLRSLGEVCVVGGIILGFKFLANLLVINVSPWLIASLGLSYIAYKAIHSSAHREIAPAVKNVDSVSKNSLENFKTSRNFLNLYKNTCQNDKIQLNAYSHQAKTPLRKNSP